MMTSTPSRPAVFRELLTLAAPLIVSNLFLMLQWNLDRLFLSWYQSEALAAAMAALMIFWVPQQFAATIAGFTATFIAQYLGAHQPERVGTITWQGLYFALIAGFFFILLAPWCGVLTTAIGHQGAMRESEAVYLTCLCFVALPTFLIAVLTAVFASRGETSSVLVINGVGLLSNAVLDYAWIFGNWGFPAWGIAGAGWATVISSLLAALVGLVLLFRPRLVREYRLDRSRFDAHLFWRLLRFGGPGGVHGAVDVAMFTFFAIVVGWMGPAELAATSIVFVINGAFFVPMIGLGQATQVLVGKRLGANDPAAAEHLVWVALGSATLFLTISAVILAANPSWIIHLFAGPASDAVWPHVIVYLPLLLWFVAIYSTLDGANIIVASALRGAGDTLFVAIVTPLVGVTILIIPVILAYSRQWGLYAAWIATTIYIMVLAAIMMLRFIFGPWRRMRVIETNPEE